MGVIHRFRGEDGGWDWEGVRMVDYGGGHPGVTVRRFIGHNEGNLNFEMRYFELQPGAHSNLEQHIHEHGVLILRGAGTVRLGTEVFPIGTGDAVFIPAEEIHEFVAADNQIMGFMCVVLNTRLREVAYEMDHQQLARA
jgi:quercetin dioxygenase-like cupin family protein